jgi:thymidylate kinase
LLGDLNVITAMLGILSTPDFIKPVAQTACHCTGKKLGLIEELLETFHNNGISYCHWKSNEHLDASMCGDTDLDVLFEEMQKDQLESLLHQLDFKKFDAAKQKKYIGIEDYIGMDFVTGKIVHLHAHFRLTIGESYLKSYQLNFEDKILQGRVYDEAFGVFRIDPAFELVLLYFRLAFKLRNRDRIKVLLHKNVYYNSDVLREYEWLKQHCTDAGIEGVLQSILADYEPIYKVMLSRFDRVQMIKLEPLVKKEFKSQRLYSPFQAFLVRAYRENYIKWYRKISGIYRRPVVLQRINPRGGLVIAIIGADGSGKSTVVQNLTATFKKKLDVYKIYFGMGGGSISWSRKILMRVKKRLSRTNKKASAHYINQATGQQDMVKRKYGFITNAFKCLEALMVANEKHSNLKVMQVAKRKGMLVICDRFPQSKILGYNDGPMVQEQIQSKNWILRFIAKKEARIYKLFDENPPDIIFKLIASADVVEARKPGETSLKTLHKKIEGFRQLKFPDSCKVITINAEEPIDKVLITIKQKIWNGFE